MIALWSLLVGGGLALTLTVLFGMGRRAHVSDESSYLEAAKQDDPHAPRPFLRVPLLTWLTRLTATRSGELPLRLLLVAVSLVTLALTAATGWYLGAGDVALVSTLLLLLQPERLILSCHIWPDGLVALAVAAMTLLLVLPAATSPQLLLALGCLGALASMARIDALILPPTAVLSLLSSRGALGATGFVLVVGPTLLVLALWTLRNFRRYGIPLPDNTWTFNLMVAGSEARKTEIPDFVLGPIISNTMSGWRQIPEAEQGRRAVASLAATLLSPWRFLRGVGRRFLALCGPDTFVRQKLLPPARAYPDLGERARRRLDLLLRVGFPLLLSLAVLGSALRRELPPPYTWPALALFVVAVLFFARTRFRIVQLPVLSLLAATGLAELPDSLRALDASRAAILLSTPLLFWALLRIRSAEEMPVRG